MLHKSYVQNKKNIIAEAHETFEPIFVQENQNLSPPNLAMSQHTY
jgi:hypothetical protein